MAVDGSVKVCTKMQDATCIEKVFSCQNLGQIPRIAEDIFLLTKTKNRTNKEKAGIVSSLYRARNNSFPCFAC